MGRWFMGLLVGNGCNWSCGRRFNMRHRDRGRQQRLLPRRLQLGGQRLHRDLRRSVRLPRGRYLGGRGLCDLRRGVDGERWPLQLVLDVSGGLQRVRQRLHQRMERGLRLRQGLRLRLQLLLDGRVRRRESLGMELWRRLNQRMRRCLTPRQWNRGQRLRNGNGAGRCRWGHLWRFQ